MSLKKIQNLMTTFAASKDFNRVLKSLIPISADDKLLICEFKVTEDNCNTIGTLHGGFSATVVDTVSTLDLLRRGKKAGVSVDLSMSYMSSAKLESHVSVESEILKAGNRLAFAVVTLRDKESGNIITQGTHTKYIGD